MNVEHVIQSCKNAFERYEPYCGDLSHQKKCMKRRKKIPTTFIGYFDCTAARIFSCSSNLSMYHGGRQILQFQKHYEEQT